MNEKEIREILQESERLLSKAEVILREALKNVRESLDGRPLKNLRQKHLRYGKLVYYISDHLEKIKGTTTTLEAINMAEDILGKVYAALYTKPTKCKFEAYMWSMERELYLRGQNAAKFYGFFLAETGVSESLDDLFVRLAEAYCMDREGAFDAAMRNFEAVIY